VGHTTEIPAWRRTLRAAFQPSPANITCWTISITALVILLALTVVLADGRVYGWEVDMTRRLQDVNYPQWAFNLTANRLTNSDTPEGAAVILSVTALLWLLRLRTESVMILLISVPLHIAANFPKAIVERARPADVIDGISGYGGMRSFPSGHAEFAITFYGFLVYVALLRIRSNIARGCLLAAWLALALAVGFARIEVGKHWPLDIVAGYVIGAGALAALIWAHRSLTGATRPPQASESANVS
jgi:membrane-associated phospholipid phosphatase